MEDSHIGAGLIGFFVGSILLFCVIGCNERGIQEAQAKRLVDKTDKVQSILDSITLSKKQKTLLLREIIAGRKEEDEE